VRFELRALRRTYGQILLDSGTSIEIASIALGHRSIKTTQAYYCQKSLDTVNSEVLRALDDTMPGTPGTEKPLISQTTDYTGYA
jgi:integrase